MARIRDTLRWLVAGEEGATMVEYALMVALIAVVCIVAVSALGGSSQRTFDNAAATIGSTTP